eukprot:15215687-Alexandrium_andersonii.AAC.1
MRRGVRAQHEISQPTSARSSHKPRQGGYVDPAPFPGQVLVRRELPQPMLRLLRLATGSAAAT